MIKLAINLHSHKENNNNNHNKSNRALILMKIQRMNNLGEMEEISHLVEAHLPAALLEEAHLQEDHTHLVEVTLLLLSHKRQQLAHL